MRQTEARAAAPSSTTSKKLRSSPTPASRPGLPQGDLYRESALAAEMPREPDEPPLAPSTILFAPDSFPAAIPGKWHIPADWLFRQALHHRKLSPVPPRADFRSTTPPDEKRKEHEQFSE